MIAPSCGERGRRSPLALVIQHNCPSLPMTYNMPIPYTSACPHPLHICVSLSLAHLRVPIPCTPACPYPLHICMSPHWCARRPFDIGALLDVMEDDDSLKMVALLNSSLYSHAERLFGRVRLPDG